MPDIRPYAARLGSLARVTVALVVGLLLAVPVVLSTAAPAHACRCAPEGVAQQARDADLVVAGTVLDVRGGERPQGDGNRPPARRGNVTLVVGVDRIYAGRVPDATIDVTTAVASSACGLGRLPTDERYFFFLTEDSRVLRATSCDGSQPATLAEARSVERVLGAGRPVATTTTPAPVRRTLVAERDVPSLSLVAAPGAGLAVVGLLGLLVLAGVGSRR